MTYPQILFSRKFFVPKHPDSTSGMFSSDNRPPQFAIEACSLRVRFMFRGFRNIYFRYLRSKLGKGSEYNVVTPIYVVSKDTLLAEAVLVMLEQIDNKSLYPYYATLNPKHSLTLRIPTSPTE
jgi:hypothetical protein